MISELVQFTVAPDMHAEFEAGMTSALNILAAAPECVGLFVGRKMEDPDGYILRVDWTTIEAHHDFRATDDFDRYSEQFARFLVATPVIFHFHEGFEPPPSAGT